MAIEIKSLCCPQCGSTDVVMESDSKGRCEACGSSFLVKSSAETNQKDEDEGIDIYPATIKYKPEHTASDFIRRAWISFYHDDAPEQIFDESFDEVSVVEHQIVQEFISANVSYHVSIGYDSEEPYTDYETYKERVPYKELEMRTKFGSTEQELKEVTKYRDEYRQRAVTKYRTVTDWRPYSNSATFDSAALLSNIKEQAINEKLFLNSIETANKKTREVITEEKPIIEDSTYDDAMHIHESNIRRMVIASLPGDRYSDLTYSIEDITSKVDLCYIAPEYVTSINYKGKKYIKKAFAFGDMIVHGGVIPNPISAKNEKKKMQDELEKRIAQRRQAVEPNIQKATRTTSLVSIALLVVSILVSLFIRSIPVIVALFVAALVAFVLSNKKVKKTQQSEYKKTDEEIAEDTKRTKAEINNYEKDHKARTLNLLNEKLRALGQQPVMSDELRRA